MLLLTTTGSFLSCAFSNTTGSAYSLDVQASWVDNLAGAITPGVSNTSLTAGPANSAIVTSPAVSTQRNVRRLSIRNVHATDTCTISIQHSNGTTVVLLWGGKLAPGEVIVLDAVGNFTKYAPTGIAYGAVTTSASPSINGFRLSARTGEPVPTADTASPGTLYFTPYHHGSIALFDGSTWVERISTEVSLALTGLMVSTSQYDVFAYWTGSALAIELSVAWTSNTVRNGAIVRKDGIWVKTSDFSRRYVGTIRATGTGTTADGAAQRFIWNADNQVERPLRIADATASWAYSSNVWRQARATSTNMVEMVIGLPACPISARVTIMAGQATNSAHVRVGIGVDSTTVDSAGAGGELMLATLFSQKDCAWSGILVAIGYHFLAWLEQGENLTTSWFGNTGSPNRNAGMDAILLC